jgi:hypothetical protein
VCTSLWRARAWRAADVRWQPCATADIGPRGVLTRPEATSYVSASARSPSDASNVSASTTGKYSASCGSVTADQS